MRNASTPYDIMCSRGDLDDKASQRCLWFYLFFESHNNVTFVLVLMSSKAKVFCSAGSARPHLVLVPLRQLLHHRGEEMLNFWLLPNLTMRRTVWKRYEGHRLQTSKT